MKILASLMIGLCLLAVSVVAPVRAQAPTLPHAFFGTVEIAGAPAPINTQVEARGAGIIIGVPGNPLVITESGKYGGATAFAPKLVVQGTIAQGAMVEFYINGVKAQCALVGSAWQDSFPFAAGAVTQLNLKIGQDAPTLPTPTYTATRPPTATPTATVPPPTLTPTATRPPTATPTVTSTRSPAATVMPTQVNTPGDAPTATRDPSAPTLTPITTPTLTPGTIPGVVTRPAGANTSTPSPSLPTSLSATPGTQVSNGRLSTPVTPASPPSEKQPVQTMMVPTPMTPTPVLPTETLIKPTARSTGRVILPSGTRTPEAPLGNENAMTKAAPSRMPVWPALLLVATVAFLGIVLWSRKR